ncbi:MAG: ArsR/SmtB family transcription factor [Thermoplasmata archaeon]
MSRSSSRSVLPSVGAAPRIAALSAALSDERRVRALLLLRSAPATVSELSVSLGLRPAETSLQLARLRREGLVRALRRGRHRIYSADPDLIARLLEVLGDAALAVPSRGYRPGSRAPRRRPDSVALRRARTCYDHLAGAAGVDLATRMERRGWLLVSATDFLLTRRGEEALLRRGVDVAACRETRRKLAPGCLDWTERRPHIGGALGAAILRSLRSSGYLVAGAGRSVRLRRPVEDWVTN